MDSGFAMVAFLLILKATFFEKDILGTRLDGIRVPPLLDAFSLNTVRAVRTALINATSFASVRPFQSPSSSFMRPFAQSASMRSEPSVLSAGRDGLYSKIVAIALAGGEPGDSDVFGALSALFTKHAYISSADVHYADFFVVSQSDFAAINALYR